MNFIRYLILVWHLRNTPQQMQIEYINILLKFGVRCNADFLHATNEISDPKWRDYFQERCYHWKTIFDPDGLKNYRHRVDYTIFELESEINRLKKALTITNTEIARLQVKAGDTTFQVFPIEDPLGCPI